MGRIMEIIKLIFHTVIKLKISRKINRFWKESTNNRFPMITTLLRSLTGRYGALIAATKCRIIKKHEDYGGRAYA